MKFLMDTDHASLIQMKAEPEFSAIAGRLSANPGSEVSYSIISLHEQFSGSHAQINRARSPVDAVSGYGRLAKLVGFYSQVLLVPFDVAAASEFIRLKAAGVRVATMDLRIASVALSRGLVLVTRNTRDFAKVPDLVTEDWTIPVR